MKTIYSPLSEGLVALYLGVEWNHVTLIELAKLFLIHFILYIYMEPIKCNHYSNQYSPLDHAEMKSQPFKLHFLTAVMAVLSGFFFLAVIPIFFCPSSP
ncbi:hypothetical protein Hanom_Chr03g00217261 [Helianthus anomalus]